jgi:hypothetical protein
VVTRRLERFEGTEIGIQSIEQATAKAQIAGRFARPEVGAKRATVGAGDTEKVTHPGRAPAFLEKAAGDDRPEAETDHGKGRPRGKLPLDSIGHEASQRGNTAGRIGMRHIGAKAAVAAGLKLPGQPAKNPPRIPDAV